MYIKIIKKNYIRRFLLLAILLKKQLVVKCIFPKTHFEHIFLYCQQVDTPTPSSDGSEGVADSRAVWGVEGEGF